MRLLRLLDVDYSVFAQATTSDIIRNLASASKIMIIDCKTLDTPAYIIEMARERDEKYNGRESDYDYNYKVKSNNIQHIVSDTILM